MSLDDATRQRIQACIDGHEVFLFMKGSPDAPQCGFSATVVQILDQLIPSYGSFDVLSDGAIREGVKEFSAWPTIPQLYVRGEFVGGCDIVQEGFATGELQAQLGVGAGAESAPSVRISDAAAEQLKAAVADAPPDHALHLAVDARYRSRLYLAPARPDDFAVEDAGIALRIDPLSAARAGRARIDLVQTPRGPAFQVELPDAPEQAARQP